MESDVLLRQFGEIEDKVSKLIEICKSQQSSNLELHHKIKQLEEELHLANESVRRHAEDKASIRLKIDNLLAKLEDMTRS